MRPAASQATRVAERLDGRLTWARCAAACAHGYTITGGILALSALVAASNRDFDQALLFLAAALGVDATDGIIARHLAVTKHWPNIDGEKLDALIDFMTFVAVPAFIGTLTGILPRPVFLWASAMVVASLVRFSRRGTKDGGRFYYLPSCWNLLIFYAFYLEPPRMVVGACVATMVVLMFVRGHFPHPTMHATRRWHLVIGTPALMIGIGVLLGMLPARPWLLLSFAYPLFYAAQVIWMTVRDLLDQRTSSLLRRIFAMIIGNYP
jgi:phosphatidylcholine synthase